MEVRVTGNFVAFVDLLKEQYRSSRDPPFGLYPPLDQHQFILAVHQTLDDILASWEDTVEFGTDEILEEEFEPEKCFDDEPVEIQSVDVVRDDAIESRFTSLDLDLYDQPFALEPPSSLLFLLTPPSEDTSEPFLPSVGTSTLQPLPISEMQLGTNSSTPVPGDPDNLNTGSSSTAAKTGVETSERRREIDDNDDDKAD